jgi:DNA polymerase epsilon subunit 1
MMQRLYRAVSSLQRSPPLEASALKKLAVSSMANTSPALQFVTTVTHFLSLDKQYQVEIHNLKRDLLKLIGVDDFSPEASFVDPSPSYVLQDVICDFCAHPRNLDLLRDPHLLNHSWECEDCGNAYNKLQIESTLIQKVYQMSYSYQSQDLVCDKCKLCKAENLSSICPTCSGQYINMISQTEFEQKMKTLWQIAKFHSMTWLSQILTQMAPR